MVELQLLRLTLVGQGEGNLHLGSLSSVAAVGNRLKTSSSVLQALVVAGPTPSLPDEKGRGSAHWMWGLGHDQHVRG